MHFEIEYTLSGINIGVISHDVVGKVEIHEKHLFFVKKI